jgi:hypothetical protein
LVFAFSSLWFAHYALSALQALRAEPLSAAVDEVLDAVPPSDTAASPHTAARLGADPQAKSDSVTDVVPRTSA